MSDTKKAISAKTSKTAEFPSGDRVDATIKRSRFSMAAGMLGVVLCSLPFYVSIVPPMTDVSQHVLVARIIAKYSDPVLRFSEYFRIEWGVTPTALFYLLLVPLQKLVGPFWDARIFLTMWVVLIWLSVWYLAKVRGQHDPWLAAIVALPLTFCWYAYKGFLPFLMSIPLFTLTVAVFFSNYRPVAKIITLWVLLSLTFGFHIVGAAAAAAVILITAGTQVFMLRRERWQLSVAAIAVLPVVLLTASFMLGESGPSIEIEYNGVLSNMIDVVKFTCTTLDEVAAIVMLLWLCLLGIVLVVSWRHLVGKESAVLLAAAALAVLAVAMPSSLGSFWPAGPRLFPFALILLIVSLPWAVFPRLPVAGSFLALLVVLSVFTVRHTVSLDKGFRDFLGAAEVVEAGRSILPILVDPGDGSKWLDPYFVLISAHTVTRGGSHPYVMATPHIRRGATPIKYRRPSGLQYTFLYDEIHPAEDYRGVSNFYDYVLLWGDSEAIDAVIESEMGRMYVRGKATLFARHELMPDKRGVGGSDK